MTLQLGSVIDSRQDSPSHSEGDLTEREELTGFRLVDTDILIYKEVHSKRSDSHLSAAAHLSNLPCKPKNSMSAHVGSLGNKPEHTAILLPERSLTVCDADLVDLFRQSIFCDFRQGAEAAES